MWKTHVVGGGSVSICIKNRFKKKKKFRFGLNILNNRIFTVKVELWMTSVRPGGKPWIPTALWLEKEEH